MGSRGITRKSWSAHRPAEFGATPTDVGPMSTKSGSLSTKFDRSQAARGGRRQEAASKRRPR